MAKFQDIVGQEQIREHLENALSTGKISHDINLVGAAVGFDRHITVHLSADIIYTDRIGLLMNDPDDIGVIVGKCLLTGTTFLAWLQLSLLTLECHGKYTGR